jgi:hypothetical protein
MLSGTCDDMIYSLARRCHLTEQIGARRRDLYADDTWTPLDSEIAWEYRRKSGDTHDSIPAAPTPQLPDKPSFFPYGSTSPGCQTTNFEREILCRSLESKLSQLLHSTLSASTGSRRFIEEIWTESSRIPEPSALAGFEASKFLENFLCLYEDMGIPAATRKLSISLKNPQLRHETTSLRFHVDTFTSPPASSIRELATKLDTLDINLVPTPLLLELCKLKLFSRHPTVVSFVQNFNCNEDLKAEEVLSERPTKAELRKIKLSVDSVIRSVLLEELKKNTISIASLYRLVIARPYIQECKVASSITDRVIEKCSRLLSESREFHSLIEINQAFRSSLFPVS